MKTKTVALKGFIYTSKKEYPGRRCELTIEGCIDVSELEERFRIHMMLDAKDVVCETTGKVDVNTITWLWKSALNHIECVNQIVVTPLPDTQTNDLYGWYGC